MNEQALIALAKDCGASKAALISAEDITLSAMFRDICKQNSCGNYGKCYMCPPDVGDIEPLMAHVKRYPHALLYQTIHAIEDSFDIEGMIEAGAQHVQCSQRLQGEVQKVLKAGFLHLSAGGCRLCGKCAKRDDLPCRFPEKALPSLESYGIDVYSTTSRTALQYINGQNTVTYFGMVLFE
ncbi:MAG: DUF2284 domain-containing protein [Clostridia bacterium]